MQELERLEDEENLTIDRKKLNEFLKKNRKNLRKKLDEIHADFVLKKSVEGNYLVSEFQMVNDFLEYLKANL
jgi:hypothetical protein